MLDARGLSCPMPVVMVQNEAKKGNADTITVLVDSRVCVENITRFAGSQGYQISVSEQDGEFTLTLWK